MSDVRTIVWYRGKDLRVSDHVPLVQAAAEGHVIPVFVVDPYFFSPKRAQELPHRMQFLLEGLEALAKNLEALGSRLVLVGGRSVDVIPNLVETLKADRVVAHRWSEPFGRERDRRIRGALGERFVLYEGETLHPPGDLRTGTGNPYGVFTPFSKKFLQTANPGTPVKAPQSLPAVPEELGIEEVPIPRLSELGITPNSALQRGGERAARDRLKVFIQDRLRGYSEDRDRMDRAGSSRLSADIKFGTLSIRTVWDVLHQLDPDTPGLAVFRNQLIWRDFAHSTLWDRPEVLKEPFKPKFKGFPTTDDAALWAAWCEGKTGFPVVDASARQLLTEGFVHNRARMISASFLTKHLLIDYKMGEAHYMKYLTDGDWAQNNLGWQWAMGCGCDAQPYFRVFNPMSQGERYDPEGIYVRRYLPELAKLPNKFIHRPWEAPASVLRDAGIVLGRDYPRPVVDHPEARKRFLELAKGFLNPGPSAP